MQQYYAEIAKLKKIMLERGMVFEKEMLAEDVMPFFTLGIDHGIRMAYDNMKDLMENSFDKQIERGGL